MPSIAVSKTLLSVVLLPVMAAGLAKAEETTQRYRFGNWVVVVPADAGPDALVNGPVPLTADGVELLVYWQDGSERAVSLHFDATDAGKDLVLLKSYRDVTRLKGCGLGARGRMPKLQKAAKTLEMPEFPDDAALQIPRSERGLRRVGDVLVADLGTARVQLTDDSPVVRVGEWNSAEFCRYEMKVMTDEAP